MKKYIVQLVILATTLSSLTSRAASSSETVTWRCGTLTVVCMSQSNSCALSAHIEDRHGNVTTVLTKNPLIRSYLKQNLYKTVYNQCAQGELLDDGETIEATYLGFSPANPGVSGFTQ